jgi:protein-L-isoaspartate(D-aspartate) O-methyltransferase
VEGHAVTSPCPIELRDWRRRAAELAGKLAAEGALPDPAWRRAFEQVPRHVFVPRFWALNGYNSPDRLVEGADPAQRDEWLDAVYSDRVLVTRWALRDGYRMASSSASLPTLVAHMLEILDVDDGHRVLEIGTGTGYNTGLLCHRVGDAQVVSIDIDPKLVADAADRLAQLGYRPHLVAGDGAAGSPEAAPYDRIQSTCASPGVPAAWIEQLADGGVIVAPFTLGGALAVLTKTSPIEVTGRLDVEQAWFMPLRPSSADPIPDGHLVDLPDPSPVREQHRGTVDMDPATFDDPDFRLWLTLHLPATARVVDQVDSPDGGFRRTGLIVHTDIHRAEARFPTSAEPIHVVQDSRRLFDIVESAWHAWQHHGRPGRERIGITARTDGVQRLWLDTPHSTTNWPLPRHI